MPETKTAREILEEHGNVMQTITIKTPDGGTLRSNVRLQTLVDWAESGDGQLVLCADGEARLEENKGPPSWAWKLEGEETATGLYGSRKEAIQYAEAVLSLDTPVLVGKAVWPSALDFAERAADIEEMEQRMDAALYDSGEFYPGDDVMFEIPESRRSDAQAELSRILGDWADRYVNVVGAWTLREAECERVIVGCTGQEGGE